MNDTETVIPAHWYMVAGNGKCKGILLEETKHYLCYQNRFFLPRVNEQKVIGIPGLLGGDKYPPKKIIKKKRRKYNKTSKHG